MLVRVRHGIERGTTVPTDTLGRTLYGIAGMLLAVHLALVAGGAGGDADGATRAERGGVVDENYKRDL